LCALESPALFALDDDTGRGVLLAERLDNDSRGDAEVAVHVCPTQAITMEEE
jgi:ferredoxin